MDMTPQAWPDWYDGKHINEVLFCQQFLEKHPMKCVRGRLFTVDGLIEDEGQIGNLILEEISGVLTANLSKTVANLLASIKLQAYSPPLPIETDRIHVANGTYFMDGRFTADKSYCNNRLTVSYNPDAPVPKRWLQFLSELLQEDDIPTLQEFLGYCCKHSTDWRKRRPETESRSAKPEHAGSFRRVRFWKRCCRRCGQWSCLHWRIT